MNKEEPKERELASLSVGDDDEANMSIELPAEDDGIEPLNFHMDNYDPYQPDEDNAILEEFD